jgi:PhzF family phenazine biosynthesis protein
MAARIPIVQVDAFADAPFRGNPAAVCVLSEPRGDAWMQNVAAEMNLAETAFLSPQQDGYALRWFTPATEVDLCGHATLASAHVLWEKGHLEPATDARFHTRSGVLTAARRDDWIELDFPAILTETAQACAPLLDGLGIQPVYVGLNKFDYLVEVASEEVLRSLVPDFGLLRRLPVRGIIVTSRGNDYDFVSRFFAPGSGIDEDPVTGSAHCALAPHWAAKLGKLEMLAYQASRRGGVVKVRLQGHRVLLSGQAVITLEGELTV